MEPESLTEWYAEHIATATGEPRVRRTQPLTGHGENVLIRAFLASRDPRLFERIITPHMAWLDRLLRVVFNGNHHDMEDARQEILIGICQDLRRFRFQSAFKTFFYRYAHHKAVDMLRRVIRHGRREENTAPEEVPVSSPEDAYVRSEERRRLEACLRLLPPVDRGLLLMKEVEDFKIDEICELTGMKSGTVKSRLSRAREKLFHLMKGGPI
jgi:RNA polymerase sigma-70 factor (ECF subfamily)